MPLRLVPFAIKNAVAQKIQHLESVGFPKKIEFSRWDTPVVPVPKRDGSFWICGDFYVTLNPVLETDQHPIPKPEDRSRARCSFLIDKHSKWLEIFLMKSTIMENTTVV